jgi:AraC-like DNA-binding protein
MDPRVRAAIDKMRHVLGDRHSVRDVAKSVNLSPRRLGQLFKEEIGVSPMQFLRNLRTARAQALLRSSFLTVHFGLHTSETLHERLRSWYRNFRAGVTRERLHPFRRSLPWERRRAQEPVGTPPRRLLRAFGCPCCRSDRSRCNRDLRCSP